MKGTIYSFSCGKCGVELRIPLIDFEEKVVCHNCGARQELRPVTIFTSDKSPDTVTRRMAEAKLPKSLQDNRQYDRKRFLDEMFRGSDEVDYETAVGRIAPLIGNTKKGKGKPPGVFGSYYGNAWDASTVLASVFDMPVRKVDDDIIQTYKPKKQDVGR